MALATTYGGMKEMAKKAGFTLVEIMIVVSIIGVLAAVATPAMSKARAKSQTNGCINNLRQLDSGKEQYAMVAFKGEGTVLTDDEIAEVLTFMKGGNCLCPADKTQTFASSYRVNPIGSYPHCKISGVTTADVAIGDGSHSPES